MRIIETIRRDYEKQKLICRKEQEKMARLEEEYFAALDAAYLTE